MAPGPSSTSKPRILSSTHLSDLTTSFHLEEPFNDIGAPDNSGSSCPLKTLNGHLPKVPLAVGRGLLVGLGVRTQTFLRASGFCPHTHRCCCCCWSGTTLSSGVAGYHPDDVMRVPFWFCFWPSVPFTGQVTTQMGHPDESLPPPPWPVWFPQAQVQPLSEAGTPQLPLPACPSSPRLPACASDTECAALRRRAVRPGLVHQGCLGEPLCSGVFI